MIELLFTKDLFGILILEMNLHTNLLLYWCTISGKEKYFVSKLLPGNSARHTRSTAVAPRQFSKQLHCFRHSSAALRMAVDPILEVDEKVVEEVAQKCDDKKNEVEPATPEKKKEEESSSCDVPASPDPYYPPIIYLPEVVVNSGEDDEEEAFKRRAKLYRLRNIRF